MDQVGTFCGSVGGVCGWSCGATISAARLPGCGSDNRIDVTSNSVAGLHTTADFQGTIDLQECMEGADEDGGCMTSPNAFQHWNCPQCKYDPNPVGSDMDISLDEEASPTRIYTSLPRMKVTLRGAQSPKASNLFNQPRVVMLRSSVAETGVWKKLYMKDTGKFELPVLVDAPTKDPDAESDEARKPGVVVSRAEARATGRVVRAEEGSTVFDAYTKQAMILRQPSRLAMQPDWCFGPRGPLYLVACAVNSTLYENEDFKNFTAGQRVAPPPFNDRCVAVSGRCGSACSGAAQHLDRCTADGYIEQSALVGKILPLGFAVKVAVLCPGIFRSYPHYRRRGEGPEVQRYAMGSGKWVVSHAQFFSSWRIWCE
ncbi:unnamed protein product [Durusdinium trenchii]|uniref:Uncharacterized protein n=1 Tax=Durusdinium trenchii TaxID=1381693 RepID=A0ABP0KZX9_9DINO